MITTRTTDITWLSEADQAWPPLEDARELKLQEMMVDGKTMPDYKHCISPVRTMRYWRDQNAAEEFASFITSQCEIYSISLVSIEFADGTWTE